MNNYQLSVKKYPVYKDSAIAWLGDVPEHWEVRRLKDIGDSIIGLTYSPEDILDCETGGILVLRSSNIQNGQLSLSDTVYVNKKVNPRQIVRKGDILICSRNGSRALIGKNICIDERTEGQTFGAFMTIYRSRYFKFISKFFNSKIFESQSGLFGSSTINQLTINTLNNFLITLPPLDEQKLIADYLDTKTAQCDRKIDLLTQKATQYGKLKQSLINETVTRGLDKSVPMKDSGVEWIGDVPEHWEIQRLKNLSQIKTGGKDTINSVEDGEYPFFVRSQTIERINSYSFDGEAILTAGDGVGVGKVFHYVNEKFDYHQRVYKISHFRGLDGKFLFYYMRNHFYKEAFRLNAKATVDSLRMPMFQNFPVVFGSKEEQKAIADYLDKKTAQIDQIIQTINTQIEKLKELRKTLINDVVTGKIRV